MRCDMCGKKFSGYDSKCPYCGASVISHNSEKVLKNQENNYKSYAEQPKQYSNQNITENKYKENQYSKDTNSINTNDIPKNITEKTIFNDSNGKYIKNYNDKPSIIFNILAVFFPYIGILISLSQGKIYPKKAKSMFIWSCVGVVLYIIYNILEPEIYMWLETLYIEELPPIENNPGSNINTMINLLKIN